MLLKASKFFALAAVSFLATTGLLHLGFCGANASEIETPEPLTYTVQVIEIKEPEPYEAPAAAPTEEDENALIEAALLKHARKIESCKITFYCAEKRPHICGNGDGITASGAKLAPGITVAVDPILIPLGSTVMMDLDGDGELEYYVAADVGGGVRGSHIDVCVSTHKEALDLGVKYADVFWINEKETCYE